MKVRFYILVGLLGLCGMIPAQNLVTNGGFETWPSATDLATSWARGAGAFGTQYYKITGDLSQGNVLRLTDAAGSAGAKRFNTTANFSILAEGTYRVTFKVKGNVGLRGVILVKGATGGSGTSGAPGTTTQTATNHFTTISNYPSSTNVADWTTLQYDIIVPSTATFGTDYRLHISWSSTTASNGCDFYIDDISLVKTIPLSTPTVSSASNFTSDGFNANWSTVANAVSYDVKLYEDGVIKSTTNVVGQASSSLTLTGLLAGKDYTYTVTAIANGTSYSNSAASAASTACTTSTPALLTPFDIRPTGFTAYWKNITNATAYTIKVYQDGDLVSTVEESGATATSAIITGLQPGLNYTYTVTGSDGFTSASSNVITTLTPVVLETFSDWTETTPSGTYNTSYSITKKLYDGVTDGTFTSNYLQVQPTQALIGTASATGNGRPSAGRLLMSATTSYFYLPLLSGISTFTLKNHGGTTGNKYKLQSSTNNVDWVDVAGTETALKSTVAEASTHAINSSGNIYVRINTMQSGSVTFWDLQVNPFISNTKLITPTITSASGISSTEFTANWEASANALGYYIKVYQNGSYISTQYFDGQSTVNGQITGLTPNTSYTYKVIARGNVSTFSSSDASTSSASFNTLNTFNIAGNASISALGTKNTSSVINVAAGAILTIDQTSEVHSITVAPGAKLTVNSILTTNGALTLESDGDATATLMDNYSEPTINATVKQHVTAGRNWYISPSISAAGYGILNRGASVVEWNEATKAWVPKSSGTLTPGKGYIQVATAVQGTTGTVDFNGLTNSGPIPVTVTRTESGLSRGFNLVGNPYPSYLDWTLVIADVANSAIGTSFWYRTKNTDGTYIFVTHNGSSGEVVGGTTANTIITKFIPPMQAFWVRVNPNVGNTTYSTSITFNNSMRDHRDNSGNKLKVSAQSDRMRVRLQVSNGITTDESLLYFDTKAQDSFDAYDSPKMFNNTASKPEIFTRAGSEQLVINGMNEIPYDVEIPLGFVSGLTGDYTISRTEFSNFSSGTRIVLKDKLNASAEFELAEGASYNFSAGVTLAATDRFSLIFRAPRVATGAENPVNETVSVFVNTQNQIVISANKGSKYAIYNAVGQLIENGILNSKIITRNSKLAAGVYVVKVNNNSTRVIIK